MDTEEDRKQGGGSEEEGVNRREGRRERSRREDRRGVPGRAPLRHQAHAPQLDCVRSHTKM